MGQFDRELEHWRERLRIAKVDLEDLTSGKRRMAEDQGQGWMDTTEWWTKKLQSEVAGLQQLIEAYEKLNKEDG